MSQALPVGTRVRATVKGFVWSGRIGTVLHGTHNPRNVGLRWDGMRTRQTIALAFVEVINAETDLGSIPMPVRKSEAEKDAEKLAEWEKTYGKREAHRG